MHFYIANDQGSHTVRTILGEQSKGKLGEQSKGKRRTRRKTTPITSF